VKIYKVETMTFRERSDYIDGEYRFRNGHCNSNPRKMIKLWAEKEFRNLKRLKESGVMCPEPVKIKDNVLVMEYIGDNHNPAPRIKDLKLE
jgi:RIO kinase 1